MEVQEISAAARSKLLKLLESAVKDGLRDIQINVGHMKGRVRANGSGRRTSFTDCFDQLRHHRRLCIDNIKDQVAHLEKVDQWIECIERSMVVGHIARCPHCLSQDAATKIWEEGALNLGGSGNPIKSSWEECDYCGGEGVVQRGSR
jgi:hypothetical protein